VNNVNYGFLRTAAATPKLRVADIPYNLEQIIKLLDQAIFNHAKMIVFPELALTGYTCGDLFLQNLLLENAKEALRQLVEYSNEKEILIFVGLPWERDGKLYNVAAAVKGGSLLGLIPKQYLPNYSEFYEARHFTPGNSAPVMADFTDKRGNSYGVPMGTDLLFECSNIPGLVVSAEICEDVWAPAPPSIRHCLAGATVIVNCSASDETTGKDIYRNSLITGQSARLVCGYIYANAGDGESTQDLVFGGHNIIGEDGICLAESKRFTSGVIYGDLDLEKIGSERRRMTTFGPMSKGDHLTVRFSLRQEEFALLRYIDASPFVPKGIEDRRRRCEEILSIQTAGLKKRLEHTNCKKAVIGISGGLDSTLAILVIARAFDLLEIDRKEILAVTMPCFGTTGRTYQNACKLTGQLGATLQEIRIEESVRLHFRDIGQDENLHDVTYENSQARERTQILMDIANKVNGMVIGTGDMSELALGWTTYNGDHMSMYGVNSSIPKTLVRHLVRYYSDTCGDQTLSKVLYDVLDTPVSPELLPPKNGEITQKTEDVVGPYELHDFFLYHLLRFGYTPAKIYFMARCAFKGAYSEDTILKWLKVFYRRFFSQQFKRSCLPDGPKVGSVAVSPRGDLRMPSDACVRIWMDELEQL